ncbi:MAG: GNAT family protein [Phycisphaerales bacterium]
MEFETRTITLRDGVRVTLRSGGAADAQADLEFLRRAVPDSPYILTIPEEILGVEEIRARLIDLLEGGGLFMIVTPDATPGVIVGVLDIRRSKRLKQAHVAGLGMMIEPAWRGRGLGRAMMEGAIAWATANPDIERLELGVFAQNPDALRLYESCGFVREGLKPDAARQASGESLDEVIMARRVKPSAAC